MRAALERIITCVEKGTMPMLRRGGGEGQRLGASRYWDKGTVRMPRNGLADTLRMSWPSREEGRCELSCEGARCM